MRVGVISFPGNTAVDDTCSALLGAKGLQPVAVSDDVEEFDDLSMLILPGGFSFGDALRPGALAKTSAITGPLKRYVESGLPVLGIGNGFQILCELGLLPGGFINNVPPGFASGKVHLKVEPGASELVSPGDKPFSASLACYSGCFIASARTLRDSEQEGRVAFRYVDEFGESLQSNPPLGSANAIAGLRSKGGNVLGVMPRIERQLGDSGRSLFTELVTSMLNISE